MVEPASPDDPVEREYKALLELDDEHQGEVTRLLDEEAGFQELEAGASRITLRARALEKLRPVRAAYEEFLKRHPSHVRARLAFGSFLNDLGEEREAVEQWDQARRLDPRNPAAWNNLANYYGHRGPVAKAFEYYARAMELDPEEPTYVHNLAANVYLFRRDAMEYYHLAEPEVFEKSLELYRQAMRLAPSSFLLASDYAQSFYGIRPPIDADPSAKDQFIRQNSRRALTAWDHALTLATDDLQRDGVHIHLARLNITLGDFQLARQHLQAVNHPEYATLRQRLERNLEKKESGLSTNTPPAAGLSADRP